MISGKTLTALLSLMMLTWGIASASEPAATTSAPAPASSVAAQDLIGSLGHPAPTRTAFAEARFMHMLDRPLISSGELAWLGGDKLQRRVETPREETATIADGEVTQQREGKRPRHFSLRHAPQLKALLDSFVALLSGDASLLRQGFEIHLAGDPADLWTLTLVPRDARVAKTVASIAIDGKGNQSRCMRMLEADGDLAVDLLGPMATRMPETPTKASLHALCQVQR